MIADVLRRAAIGLTFLVALLLLPPWIPAMPGAGLDAFWEAALHAFNAGWQFGPQIFFTYGPYASLAVNVFDPANYAVMLAFWRSRPFAAAAVCLVNGLPPLESVTLVVLAFVGLRTGVAGAHDTLHGQIFNDPVFFLPPLLALFVCFHPLAAVRRWLTPPLITLTATCPDPSTSIRGTPQSRSPTAWTTLLARCFRATRCMALRRST
jgi:hypothetical protein